VTSDDQWIDLAVEAGQLREAMATRPMIDLAKGIVMAARRCSAEEAFAELRTVSSRTNVKVADLARALARCVEVPPEQLPADDEGLDRADVVAARWLREMGVHPAREDERADSLERRVDAS
jgi:hypothetical protein